MEDKALYTQILGIQQPWEIDHIDLDMDKEELMFMLNGQQKQEPLALFAKRSKRRRAL